MESDPNIELALDRIASSNDDELVSWFHMDITEQAWQLLHSVYVLEPFW